VVGIDVVGGYCLGVLRRFYRRFTGEWGREEEGGGKILNKKGK